MVSDYTQWVYNYENLNENKFEVKYYKYVEQFKNYLQFYSTFESKYYKTWSRSKTT